MHCQWKDKILSGSGFDFQQAALDIFRFQFENNTLYNRFIRSLKIDPATVKEITRIPFLPIGFFKSQDIQTTTFIPDIIFESSGTTGNTASRHLVKDSALYEWSFEKGFEIFYGSPADWCIIGLLPSYLERKNSSLVYMVNKLIRASGHDLSGFYLDEFEKLLVVLLQLEKENKKTLLIGVSFALLDLASYFSGHAGRLKLQHTTIMETGGMKGRRKEMIRQELHSILCNAFGVSAIHSEYGMTELLSQAYSAGEGIFKCPPWMKLLIRDEDDPLSVREKPGEGEHAKRGAVNIIDLGNMYSCSFIATDDAGKLYPDGSFEILGRMDHADLRGCSLMLADDSGE